jgi:hypothetical protein
MLQQETNTLIPMHQKLTPRTLVTHHADKEMATNEEGTGRQGAAAIQQITQGQARAQPTAEIADIRAQKHEIFDGRSWAFDIQLTDQTKGTADPNKVSGVLGDYISLQMAYHFNYEAAGISEIEWSDMCRAVFRPRAGNVWTVNVREIFKPLFPACLDKIFFIQDADDQDSKFKLCWKGETTIAPFAPASSDIRWFHFFIPATCLASKPEIKTAIAGKLEEIGIKMKPEEKDFKQTIPAQGKWHVNFELQQGRADMIAENLYKLAKLEIENCGIKTYMSPTFMEKIPQNCPGCYTWLKFNECFCPKKDERKDGYKRAKDGHAAAQRKRRMQAASSSSAAF